MGNCTRKQTQLLLAFKVLYFVNQLRRRVTTRVQGGFDDEAGLGDHLQADGKAMRRISELSRLGARSAKPQRIANRIGKCRKNDHKLFRPVLRLRTLGAGPSVCSNESGDEVQHEPSTAEAALTTIASDNKLFLKHGSSPILHHCSLRELNWLLLSTFAALQTLADVRSQYSDKWLAARGQDFGLNIDETFVANYEHLLLRLQAELENALQRKGLDELLHPTGRYDKTQRQLLTCFNEWADKPRPLSMSFPWTIKPSLAVLWGVCWMFYEQGGNAPASYQGANNRVAVTRVLQHVDVPWTAPGSSEYLNFGLEMIGQQSPLEMQQQTGDNMPVGPESDVFEASRNADTWQPDWHHLKSRHPSLTNVSLSPIGAGSTAPFPGTYYRAAPQQYPIYPDNYLPQNPGATSITAFAQLSPSLDQSAWHQLPYSSSPLPQHSPRHLIDPPPTPSIRVTGTAGTGSEVFAPPQSDFAAWPNYIFNASGPPQHQNQNYYLSNNMGHNLPPVNSGSTIQLPQIHLKHERSHSNASNTDMPTPVSMAGNGLPSPIGDQQRTTMSSPHTHTRQLSEDISSHDEQDGSLRKNNSYKRAEEPPRNDEAKMICKHSECSGITFDRKCEWSKHMDKHDRPYKCLVKGCEKLQGFTYSGGLLRHEREVHKMHGGTKKSLFCPFTDCKRSSGAGFTRKENLAEHIRRVHRRTSMSADMHGLVIRRDTMERSPTVESRQASESPYIRNMEYRHSEEPALKRKRISDSVISDRADEDLRAEIKRLRHENEEKDLRLRQLEQAVMALQQNRR